MDIAEKGNLKKETESLLIATENTNAIRTDYEKAKIGMTQQNNKRRIFQATNKQNLTRDNLDIAEKGNLQKETVSLLIATENNNAIRTDYEKAKIGMTQQNNKRRIFQATNKQNLTRDNLDIAEKGNLKKETESLLIATENNNAIRTDYEKAKIGMTQQNNKRRIFQATNKQNLTRDNLDIAEKGNLKKETESLLIATENNNAIRTDYEKAKIGMTQQNNKRRLCGDRDEIINYMITSCTKWA